MISVPALFFRTLILISLLLPMLTTTLVAQTEDRINVFLDCRYCDDNYVRTEINYVNYVRDRKEADVHIQSTRLRTGSGGNEYTMTFLGSREFAGLNDTLVFASNSTHSDDEIRDGMTNVLRLGLIRYIARTSDASLLSVSYQAPEDSTDTQPHDPWNYWVFQTRFNGYFNGQESTNSMSLFGSINADRVTEIWKIDLSVYGSYSENNFSYDDLDIKSISRSRSFYGFLARAINENWSVGARTNAFSSTFSNIDFQASAAPALEYNFYPYKESTRHELTVTYYLNYFFSDYTEETIYFKTEEHLLENSLRINFEQTKPWGSVEITLEGSHYFHDTSKYRIEFSSELEFQLIKGLSFDMWGSVSKINDQLSLASGGASLEEVLLQRQQLATDYSYWAGVGFSYTFGSIYNNIVNPRF